MNEQTAKLGPNEIMLNGQARKLLPLNWEQLKERREDIIVINSLRPGQGMFTDEQQEAIANVVLASLQRSDELVTMAYVLKHVDLGNVGVMLKMIFGQQVQTTQGAPSGEAQAATSQS